LDTLDLITKVLLQGWQIKRIVFRDEANGHAICTGTTGSTDAMNVVFWIIGQFKVNHVSNTVNVDATPGNVGGDQVLKFAFFETVQCRQAFFLRYVAGQALTLNIFLAQISNQSMRLIATVGKDYGALWFLAE
jgi:hypothetical protein